MCSLPAPSPRTAHAPALIDVYLKGSRTLSNVCMLHLIAFEPAAIAPMPPPMLPLAGDHGDSGDGVQCAYKLLLCAAHFNSDVMTLHACANDLSFTYSVLVSIVSPTGQAPFVLSCWKDLHLVGLPTSFLT